MMKSKLIILVLLGVSGFGAEAAAGRIIDSVICQSDPSQSYALYVPVRTSGAVMPVVYFFDSHGDGGHPLRKYKALADQYGFVLAGSNNSKNGNDWAQTDKMWRSMSGDLQGRVRIDKRRVYTCGFSGGAKVAGYVAIQYPGISGVVLNGAGLPDGVSPGDFGFSITSLAGEGDMNMTDLVGFDRALERTRTRHRLLLFDGIHEWAPEAVMGMAFAGWVFDAMRAGSMAKEKPMIDRSVAGAKVRIEGYVKGERMVRAWQESVFMKGILEGVDPAAGWFGQRAAAIAGDRKYQMEREGQENLLATERQQKNEYMQHFQQGDARYWEAEVGRLRVRVAEHGRESGMDQRLLAYLSLAFYSFSHRTIMANDNAGARHFVELYKLADPGNSEAWYFSAVLDAREGHGAVVEADLLKAVGLGFRDMRRLRQQPEFQRAGATLDFARLERAMRIVRPGF